MQLQGFRLIISTKLFQEGCDIQTAPRDCRTLAFLSDCVLPLWVGLLHNALYSIMVYFFDNHVKQFIRNKELRKIICGAIFSNSTHSSSSCSEGCHIYGSLIATPSNCAVFFIISWESKSERSPVLTLVTEMSLSLLLSPISLLFLLSKSLTSEGRDAAITEHVSKFSH